MRYMGKGSVSSFLGVALNLAWFTGFVAMGGILLGMLTMGIFGARIPHNLGRVFTFDAQFLSFGFSHAEIRDPRLIFLGTTSLVLVSLVVAQAVIHQLRLIFRTLQAQTPFTLENARRIQTIGFILIGGSFLQALAGFLVGLLMMNNIVIPGVELNVKSDFHMNTIFIGLVILVLAEIFRHGAALQEEQNLTV